MDLSEMINALMPFILGIVMLVIIWSMIKQIVGNVGRRPTYGMIPTSVGDRLKKYILKASKSNPHNVKELYLKRTEYSSGGRIGVVKGVLPTKYCTRFIFKNRRLGWMKLMYCPADMHTSLHSNQVQIDAIGLDNAGGFYYPVPHHQDTSEKIFKIFRDALNIDLKRMQIVDMMQLEQEQIYSSIAGSTATDEVISGAPEDMVLERVPEGDAD